MLETLKNSISTLHLVSLIAVLLLAVAATNDQVTQSATGAFTEITSLDTGAAPTPETNSEETNTVNLQQGLQSYWRFDDPEVSRGHSLEFDGNNDYIRTEFNSYNVSPISVSAWAKFDSVADGDYDYIIGSSGEFGLRQTKNADNIQLLTYNGSVHSTSVSGIKENKWYHVVGVFNGSAYKVYLNGELGSVSLDSVYTPGENNESIGAMGDSRFLDGEIDDVHVYNRTLSSSEVQDLYNERPVSRDGLVLHQDFNEGPDSCDLTSSTACLSDESGEGNDGTPQNFDDNDFNTGSGWFNETPLNRPTVKDYSSNSHTGRFYGGNNGKLKNFNFSHPDSGWVSGAVGEHALEFDNEDDFVEVPNLVEGRESATVGAWVKLQSKSDDRAMIGDWGSSNNSHLLWYDVGTDSFKATFRNRAGADPEVRSTTNPVVGDWYFVAWSVSNRSNSMKMFVDGTLEDESSTSRGIIEGFADMGIGGDYNSHPNMDGSLDSAVVYNHVLTESEVQSLYQGEFVKEGLVGRWNFEAGDRKTAYDTSSLIGRGVLDTSSVDLDGSDDFIGVPQQGGLAQFEGEEITVAGWLNLDNLDKRQMFTFSGGGWRRKGMYHAITTSGGVRFQIGNGTSEAYVGSGVGEVRPNNWVHVASKWKNGTIYSYVNGREYEAIEYEPGYYSNPNYLLAIGRNLNNNNQTDNYLNGNIDELRIYNRSLSQKEIQRLAFQ